MGFWAVSTLETCPYHFFMALVSYLIYSLLFFPENKVTNKKISNKINVYS